jgi:hypothetical protein
MKTYQSLLTLHHEWSEWTYEFYLDATYGDILYVSAHGLKDNVPPESFVPFKGLHSLDSYAFLDLLKEVQASVSLWQCSTPYMPDTPAKHSSESFAALYEIFDAYYKGDQPFPSIPKNPPSLSLPVNQRGMAYTW